MPIIVSLSTSAKIVQKVAQTEPSNENYKTRINKEYMIAYQPSKQYLKIMINIMFL